MNWIRSLRLSQKLILISFAYLIPIATLVYCVLGVVFEKLHFTEQETRGNALQRAVMPILQKVTERSAYQYHSKAGEGAQKVAALATDIDAAWSTFEQVYGSQSTNLQFTPEGLGSRSRTHLAMNELKGKWQAVKNLSQGASGEDVRAAHRALTDSLNGVIAHLGDTSNLILDPELDSYYLMDVTLAKLPIAIDRLSEASQDLLDYQSRESAGDPSKELSEKLTTHVAILLESLIPAIKADLDTSSTEDGKNHGAAPGFSQVTPLAEAFYADTKSFAALIKTVASDSSASISRTDTLDALVRAQNSGLTLWNKSVESLDAMFAARKSDDQKQLFTALIPALLAYLFAGTLVILVSKLTSKQLNDYIQRLQQLGSQVSNGVGQVSSASHALAQATSEQAASLEETAASLHHILGVSTSNADNCQKADGLAVGVKTVSENGSTAMQEMSTAMKSIKSSADETAGIVRTIDDIAFQTNLLALNAAVEAARAGESGKGFAVVAEEVRRLAQRSADAARDTSSKIMRSLELAENGVGVSTMVQESLEKIRGNAVDTASIMREIATATKESTSGINQITTSIGELDKVTQSNSASAQQLAAAGSTLQGHVKILGDVIHDIQGLISSPEKMRKGRGSPRNSTSFVEHSEDLGGPALNMSRGMAPKRSIPTVVAAKNTSTSKKSHRAEQIIPLDAEDLSDF